MNGLESLSYDALLKLSSVSVFLSVSIGVALLGPAWDRLTQRFVAEQATRLQELRISVTHLPLILRFWGGALFGSFFLLFFVWQQYPLAFVVAGLLYVTPHHVIRFVVLRRRRQLRDQMVAATVGLANSVRAGLGLAQGLELICDDTPEPLATEVKQIVFEWQCGRPLTAAIMDVKKRLNLDSFTLFAVAIDACVERGGRITDALERISHSLSENQRLERKLDADTSVGRSTVIVLGLFPVAFLAGFMAMGVQDMDMLFTTLMGQFVFAVIILIVYIAMSWAVRILRVDV
jgi:tight adherence protein B